MTSWPLSISSRARLRPTLPAPTMIDVHRLGRLEPERAARTSRSRAWSGEIVSSPARAYQAARAGSITRTITRSTPKRVWAICAITRFVLSPSVEAMNTSARSMPASISASISSAVPTVNWPPRVLPALRSARRRGARARAGPRRGPRLRGRRRAPTWRPPSRRGRRPRSGRTCAGDQTMRVRRADSDDGARRARRPRRARSARPQSPRRGRRVTITRHGAL